MDNYWIKLERLKMKYRKSKKQTIISRLFVAMLIVMVTMSFMPKGFFGEAVAAAPGKASNHTIKAEKATSKDAKKQVNPEGKKDAGDDKSGKTGDKTAPDKKPESTPDADGEKKPDDKKGLDKKPDEKGDKKDDSKILQKKSPNKLRKAGEKKDVVAIIGDKEYETLQKAINEAGAGDTILLKKDIKENVSIRKGVIIDLGGHSLSGTDKIPVDINASGKAVTIKNGSIVGIKSAYTGSLAAIKISNTPINLEGISITGCSGPGAAIVDSSYTSSGTLSRLTNVTISGNKSQCIWGGIGR